MKTTFPADSPTFGDNVRIRSSPATESKGVAGLAGQVYGQTTPSETGVEVIGDLTSDYAINVFFEDRKESFWFAQELVEFIDHAPGTMVTLEGTGKRYIRTETGEWDEESFEENPPNSSSGLGIDAELIFCPTCKAELHDHLLLDPNLQGLSCPNGHIFYSTLDEQFGGIPKANSVHLLPRNRSDVDVLRFWLTKPRARKTLPNQLAVACRRVAEILEHDHHVTAVERPFSFCPRCGDPIAWFECGDLYLQGLKCGNGHEFYQRGVTIYFKEGDVRTNLSAEMDDNYLPQILESWLRDSEWTTPYVHTQLREVLQRFKK